MACADPSSPRSFSLSSIFGELTSNTDNIIWFFHESLSGQEIHLNKAATSIVLQSLFDIAGGKEKINKYVNECIRCDPRRFDPQMPNVNLDWNLTPLDLKQLFYKEDIKKISKNTKSESVKMIARNCVGKQKQDMSSFLNPEELPALKALSEELKRHVFSCYERLHQGKKRANIETHVSLAKMMHIMHCVMKMFHAEEDAEETRPTIHDTPSVKWVKVRSLIPEEQEDSEVKALLKKYKRQVEQHRTSEAAKYETEKPVEGKRDKAEMASAESQFQPSDSDKDKKATKSEGEDTECTYKDNPIHSILEELSLRTTSPQAEREELDTSGHEGVRKHQPSGKGSTEESAKQSTKSKSSDDPATKGKVDEAEISAGDELQPPDSGMAQETTKLEDDKETAAKGKTDEAEISSAGDSLQPPDSGRKQKETKSEDEESKFTEKGNPIPQADGEQLETSARSKVRSGKGSTVESTKQSTKSKSSDNPATKGKVDKAEIYAGDELQPPDSGLDKDASKLTDVKTRRTDMDSQTHSSTMPDLPDKPVWDSFRRYLLGTRYTFNYHSIMHIIKHLSYVIMFTVLTTVADINPRDKTLKLRLLPEVAGMLYVDYFLAVFHFPIPNTSHIYHLVLSANISPEPSVPFFVHAEHSHVSSTILSTSDKKTITERVSSYFQFIAYKHFQYRMHYLGNGSSNVRTRIILPFSNCGLGGMYGDGDEIVVVPDCFVDYYLGRVIYIIKHIVGTVPLARYPVDSYKIVLDNCLVAVMEGFNQSLTGNKVP